MNTIRNLVWRNIGISVFLGVLLSRITCMTPEDLFSTTDEPWHLSYGTTMLITLCWAMIFLVAIPFLVTHEIKKVISKILDFDWSEIRRIDNDQITAEEGFVRQIMIPYGKDPFLAKHIELLLRTRMMDDEGFYSTERLALAMRKLAVYDDNLALWIEFVTNEAKDSLGKRLEAPVWDEKKSVAENTARIENFLKGPFAQFLTVTENWWLATVQSDIEEMFRSIPQEHLGNLLNTLGQKAEKFLSNQNFTEQYVRMFQWARVNVLKAEEPHTA